MDFNKLIDSHLAREFTYKKLGRYYPSEIGSCLRKTWYSYKKPKPTDTSLIRIFEAGNMLHSFVEAVIKSEKNPEIELLQSEVPFKLEQSGFLISGRIDDLMLVKIENKKVLVEVKSCKYLPQGFKKEHESQLQLYMHSVNVYEGVLLYIQKDNLQTKWFEVKYDSEKIKKILQRFNELHFSLIQDKIPKAEAKHDPDLSWLCDKCSWKEECWARKD